VNLSPASVRKCGTGLDLGIALAILAEREKHQKGGSIVACGELSLDGSLHSAGRVTRTLFAAWKHQASKVIIPASDIHAAQASLSLLRESSAFQSPSPTLLTASSLSDAWNQLVGKRPSCSIVAEEISQAPLETNYRRADTSDHELLPLSPLLERAILASSLGSHHLLLLGPKGSGKSHALKWLQALQPERSGKMQLHHQLLAELRPSERVELNRAPFRRVGPHTKPFHLLGSARASSMKPGEYSLAHGGLLIADEFPEWARDSRESLRGPLESGTIAIPGAQGASSELPARFLFAATGNLCPCGGWPRELPLPETSGSGLPVPNFCNCSPAHRKHYRSRISGPVLDRMDIVLFVTSMPDSFAQKKVPIQALRERLSKGRIELEKRWGEIPGRLSAGELERLLETNQLWQRWLGGVRVATLRSRHKVIRLALTLAWLDGQSTPSSAHFAEAAYYRAETALTG